MVGSKVSAEKQEKMNQDYPRKLKQNNYCVNSFLISLI